MYVWDTVGSLPSEQIPFGEITAVLKEEGSRPMTLRFERYPQVRGGHCSPGPCLHPHAHGWKQKVWAAGESKLSKGRGCPILGGLTSASDIELSGLSRVMFLFQSSN
jgi:hypothetical protein